VGFAAGEELIQDRKVADEDGDEAQAGASLDDRGEAGGRGVGDDVAIAQGEEGDTAEVDLVGQR
jgi:hypothetical protein